MVPYDTTILIYIITTFTIACGVPVVFKDENINCGYQACKPIKEGHRNVHLVAHSHNDVGWLKTVEQYYYGVPVLSYGGAVQYIYRSVLDSLKLNEDRRFIVVETAFFWKWWNLQNEKTQRDFTALVMNGQIEFTGGGWVMNDEAVTHYQSTIDQMTWGLKRLNDTFNECSRPRAGWQIDPFGHSSEMATIFSQMGYDGIILGRIDFQDKINRQKEKTMDMVWRGSNSLGSRTDIFTSALYELYDAPERFCFEQTCNTRPLIDDIESPEYNIDGVAQEFLYYVNSAIKAYSSENVLIPMGRDFGYQNAEMWFINMDKLIKYINGKEFNGQKYNLMYSTPACYMYAVHNETGGIINGTLKTDDFFPYASDVHQYWTGFYTSRPQIKRFERIGNNFLQVSKQLYALSGLTSDYSKQLNALREAMGVLQHHDAITGTEKQVVGNDYEKQLYAGIAKCKDMASDALSILINEDHPAFEHCLLTNISQCTYTETFPKFVITIYNPLSRLVNKFVRVPVLGTSYKVFDPLGTEVATQIMPIHQRLLKMPGRTSNSTVELVFQASSIPPFGFKSFYVQMEAGNDTIPEQSGLFKAQYEKTGFDVDPTTGFVGKVTFENNVTINLEQTFQYYCGSIDKVRPSGAYIFRRAEDINVTNVVDTVASNKLFVGPLVTELHQVYNGMVSQTIRMYYDERFLEFDWIIGSLPNYLINGREVITKYSTQLKTHGIFFTDSNGRELLQRKRNFRPTWNVSLADEEPGNYYPVTSRIVLSDDDLNLRFSILTDRAQGGSSLKDGQIELMLHRGTQLDDLKGLDEKLFDWAYSTGVVVRGSHYMIAGHITSDSQEEENIFAVERELAERKILDTWTFISIPFENDFASYRLANQMEFHGIGTTLPRNVRVLTLEPWEDSTLLLRLEHTFAVDEHADLSKPVTINLTELFNTFQIISARETTLGGNQWLDDNEKLLFKASTQTVEAEEKYESTLNEFEVTLIPMQIRTFLIKIEPKIFNM